MLHNSLFYSRKNSEVKFHNLYRIIALKIYEMVCNSYMIYHKNKKVFNIIRSKKLPETISSIDKSQDSREAQLLTQHFCKSSRSKRGVHTKNTCLSSGKATRRSRGRQKSWLSKNPSRHVGSKYMLLGWGVLGGVQSARPWLSLPNVPIGQFKFIHSLL